MRFYGNEICCASYACLNTIEDKSIPLSLFELTTGVPFGVCHAGNEHFDRILTTYKDPNKGIDHALTLWGYSACRADCQTSYQAVRIIKEWLYHFNRVIVGPLDMGKLPYYPMASLLQHMDHYIVLRPWSSECVLCIDSEGWVGYPLTYQSLINCLAVDDIPESCGNITIRHVVKMHDWNIGDIVDASILIIRDNLLSAEQEGAGAQAFLDSLEYLNARPRYRWKLPLMYDIQYLKQRKQLFLWYVGILCTESSKLSDVFQIIYDILLEQNHQLANLYLSITQGTEIAPFFYNLFSLEKELAQRWGDAFIDFHTCSVKPDIIKRFRE